MSPEHGAVLQPGDLHVADLARVPDCDQAALENADEKCRVRGAGEVDKGVAEVGHPAGAERQMQKVVLLRELLIHDRLQLVGGHAERQVAEHPRGYLAVLLRRRNLASGLRDRFVRRHCLASARWDFFACQVLTSARRDFPVGCEVRASVRRDVSQPWERTFRSTRTEVKNRGNLFRPFPR